MVSYSYFNLLQRTGNQSKWLEKSKRFPHRNLIIPATKSEPVLSHCQTSGRLAAISLLKGQLLTEEEIEELAHILAMYDKCGPFLMDPHCRLTGFIEKSGEGEEEDTEENVPPVLELI